MWGGPVKGEEGTRKGVADRSAGLVIFEGTRSEGGSVFLVFCEYTPVRPYQSSLKRHQIPRGP
jgi:hypothetical protein